MVSSFRKLKGYTTNSSLSTRQFRQVVKIVNAKKELKRVYYNLNAFASTDTGNTTEITSISEGNNWNERDSDRIQCLSLKGNIQLYGPDTTNTIRVMIVRSKTGPLVLGDFPTLAGQPDLDKYQILFDRTYMTASEMPITERSFISIKFKNKKVPGLNVGYDNSVSNSFAQSNPIYLWSRSDSALEADPLINGQLELKFYDKK